MSWENLGSMNVGTAQAVVYSIDGGTNFRWARVDGEAAFTGLTNYTDPALVIEAAWSWLNTQGGGVLHTRGPGETWSIQTTINSQGNDVTWVSDKGLEILLVASGDVDMIDVTHDHLSFKGLVLNGNKGNQSVGADLYGIEVTSCDDVLIRDCIIHSVKKSSATGVTTGTGIRAIDCTDVKIEFCRIYNCGDDAVDSGGLAISIEDSEDCHVQGNYCYDCAGGIYIGANSGETCNGNVIEGNTIYQIERNGIALYPYADNTPDVNYNTVINNTIWDTGQSGNHEQIKVGGVDAGDVDYNTIDGNTIFETNHQYGVGVRFWVGADFNVFSNNVIEDTKQRQFVLGGNYNTIDGNIFHYSDFRENLEIQEGASGNIISDNQFYVGGSIDSQSIMISAGTKNVIRDNYFTEYTSGKTGIYIEGDSDNNVIEGNFFETTTGVNISAATVNNTRVFDNDFSQTTTPISDSGAIDGTGTIMHTHDTEFVWYGAGSAGLQTNPTGIDIDASNEEAWGWGTLPLEVQQVVRVVVWATGKAAPGVGNQMEVEFEIRAGQRDEGYNAENIYVPNKDSDQTNFAVDDIITWTFTSSDDTDIGDLVGEDCYQVRIRGEVAVAPDIDTDAVFRIARFHYV